MPPLVIVHLHHPPTPFVLLDLLSSTTTSPDTDHHILDPAPERALLTAAHLAQRAEASCCLPARVKQPATKTTRSSKIPKDYPHFFHNTFHHTCLLAIHSHIVFHH